MDNIYTLAKRELKQLVNQTPGTPTPNDHITVIILAHGNSVGQIALAIAMFIRKTSSARSNHILTLVLQLSQTLTTLRLPNGKARSFPLEMLAMTTPQVLLGVVQQQHCPITIDGLHRRTPSHRSRRHGSIFITHVLKTANPDASIKVHTVETKQLVVGNTLSVHGKP